MTVGVTTTAMTGATGRELNRARHLTLDKQPDPKGSGPEVLPLVLADLAKMDVGPRDHEALRLLQLEIETRMSGKAQEYGCPLRLNNSRDGLIDAYQEGLDLVAYLRQHVTESEGDGYWIYQGAINLAHRIRIAILRRDGW